jgi:hypothetical protein
MHNKNTKNKKENRKDLIQENVLSKHQMAEEDYVAKAGTSEGLTSMQHPKTETE